MNAPNRFFFHAESALPPDKECYIERAADAALLKALLERQYSMMLSSRKVGKSSLLERAFVRLREAGVLVAKKELAEADEEVGAERWYSGLVQELVNDALLRNGFEVAPAWRTWWKERDTIPPGQRFTDFLRTFLLEPSTQDWVIAIDEIDTMIALGFSDDFFAAVRRYQNARAADPLFRRLTFLLAGVASPAQLIKDNRRTPFNIGHAVTLTDFSAQEAKVLLRGLGEGEDAAHPALERVLHWTAGHPFLTQKVFVELANSLEEVAEAGQGGAGGPDAGGDWVARVDAAVKAAFVHPGARSTEPHFHDIARRRVGGLSGKHKRRVLAAYRDALRGRIRTERRNRRAAKADIFLWFSSHPAHAAACGARRGRCMGSKTHRSPIPSPFAGLSQRRINRRQLFDGKRHQQLPFHAGKILQARQFHTFLIADGLG